MSYSTHIQIHCSLWFWNLSKPETKNNEFITNLNFNYILYHKKYFKYLMPTFKMWMTSWLKDKLKDVQESVQNLLHSIILFFFIVKAQQDKNGKWHELEIISWYALLITSRKIKRTWLEKIFYNEKIVFCSFKTRDWSKISAIR